MAISIILLVASSLLLSVRASHNASALAEMIDLAIARAERTLMTIRLGFYACIVAAFFGLAGTVIRTYLARPPQMSPLVDLTALAIFALGLFLYGRHTRANLKKFIYLKHAVARA